MASSGLRESFQNITSYLLFLIAISTLGPLLFGFHLAELNAPQDVITCKDPINAAILAAHPDANLPQCIPMNDAEYAAISSMFVLGGFAGAIAAGPISSRYGRLLSMRLTSIFFVVGGTIETLSGSITVLSLGRFLAGVGAGASTVIVPLYISEISPPSGRGFFGTMTQIMINMGILITQILGYYLSRGSLWRIILAVGCGLGLFQGLGLVFVPESPSWLAAHRRSRSAINTLQRIRGNNTDISDEVASWDADKPTVAEEEHLLSVPARAPLIRNDSALSTASLKAMPHVGFFQVIRDPLYRPAVIAVIGIMFAQQLCGINSVMMYSVSILEGALPMSSSLLTIGLSLGNVLTTALCAPLPDKIGRKTCLLISIAGQGIMGFCLAVSLRFEHKLLSALSVLFYVAFFAVGLGPVPFILASELVGQEAVGSIQSWCLAANYIATFLVAQFFPMLNLFLNTKYGGRGWAYFIFAAMAAVSFAFISWWVPETQGKSDPDEVWGRERRID